MKRTDFRLFVVAGVLLVAVGCGPRSGDDAAVPARDPVATVSPGGSAWAEYGFDIHNTNYNSAEQQITASTVARLQTKWVFPVEEMPPSTPSIVDGVVYVGTWAGVVHAVDAATGEEIWRFNARELVGEESAWIERGIGIRSGLNVSDGHVYFGDTGGYLTAVDAADGQLVWRHRLEDHPHTRVFSTPRIHEGRIYVGVSSLEESAIRVNPLYDGYTFRGSVVCLDQETGEEIWRFYTIPVQAAQTGTKYGDRPVYGPSGASVWATVSLDPGRGRVFAATGNPYTGPKEHLGLAEAVLALDMETGELHWSHQAKPGADDLYTNERLEGDDTGPDLDFGSGPLLVGGPDGTRWLAVGQKSGWLYLFDPDTGEKLWETKVGRGGGLGGIEFGSAYDGVNVYSAIAAGTGTLSAIDVETGEIRWETLNDEGVNHAPVTISGPAGDHVVFVGSNRGKLRAYHPDTGEVLWDYQFEGGVSIQGGAAIGEGILVVGAGYHSALGGARPGEHNEVRAFAVDGQ